MPTKKRIFSYLMIEEILFILECFGATDIFQKEMGECCGNDISIFGWKFNFWLRSIIDYENLSVGRLWCGWWQKVKLKQQQKIGEISCNMNLMDLVDCFVKLTLVDGHKRKVAIRFGINFKIISLIVIWNKFVFFIADWTNLLVSQLLPR